MHVYRVANGGIIPGRQRWEGSTAVGQRPVLALLLWTQKHTKATAEHCSAREIRSIIDRMTIRKRNAVPPLRIAVIGAGSIGSALAFQLARVGGHDVTAIARPGSLRLEQLRRDLGIVNTEGEHVALKVMDALDKQVPYDLIVVTVLAHQVDAVMPALQGSAGKEVLFMFNNFEPERLRDAIGAARCSFGMPFIQARLDQSGKLRARIGVGGQKSKIGNQRWVDVFNAAAIPAVLETKMLLWLRSHVPLGAAFESVSVMAVRRGGGASWKQAMAVAGGARESFTLIQRLGYDVYPAGKALLQKSPTWVLAGVLWSMSRVPSFRELLATGLNECHALVDSLLASARRNNVSVSLHRIAAMKPAE